MKILGMGVPELLIILAVILLIFGPKNLPKLGASVGKTVKSLRINQPILPLPRREPSLPRAQQPPAASVPWAVAHFEEGGRQARSDTASPL